jgi:DNA processing protein
LLNTPLLYTFGHSETMSHKNDHEQLYHEIALSFVPGIGAKTGRVLLEHFGDAGAIFKASLKDIKHIDGIGEVKAKGFRDAEVLKRADEELGYVINNDLDVISLKHNYPKRLENCIDAPLVMYSKGRPDLDATKIVAIVGTRKNTEYGCKLCEDLVESLRSVDGLLVVSGLALGVDAIAHKKCVQLGVPTVGVLGHGHDRMYPHTHTLLAEQMTANGGVLTEFPSGTVPDKNNFPMRNRIVAGLSDVTVVIESPVSGGALITARMASGYNREVAAYPGRVGDTRSAGCNELIRTNVAALITCADDLLEMMNWKDSKQKVVQKQLFLNLSVDEQKVVDLLQTRDSVHADELYHHTGLHSSMLAATLLQLEMQGIVKALPGKYYRMY